MLKTLVDMHVYVILQEFAVDWFDTACIYGEVYPLYGRLGWPN